MHVTLSRHPDLAGAAGFAASGSALLDRNWLRHAYGLRTDGASVHGPAVQGLAVLAAHIPDFTPSPLFDPGWVRRQTGDTRSSVFGLIARYHAEWERAGISPNPFFPPATYAAAAGPEAWRLGPLLHFLQCGEPGAAIYFDAAFYAASLEDPASLGAFGLTAFAHYVAFGWRDGRAPNGQFDEAWYAAQTPGVSALIRRGRVPNGFSHFLMTGEAEGRAPNPFFDPACYLRANPDVAAQHREGALWSAFRHWWDSGRYQGWRNRNQASPAACAVCAFMQAGFPVGGDRDAVMQAAAAFAAAGTVPPRLHAAAAAVFRRQAQPVVAIEAPDMPEPVPGEPACHAFLTGIAVMPFHALASVTVIAEPPDLRVRVVRLMTVPLSDFLEEDPFGLAIHGTLRPGFLLELAVLAQPGASGVRRLGLRFMFEAAGSVREAVQAINIQIGEVPPTAPESDRDQEAVVCLAAYSPDAVLFATQIRSVLAQRGVRLRLLISDDATPAVRAAGLQAGLAAAQGAVTLGTSGRNRGITGNFERALRMAGPGSGAVLLADQDDRWHPGKARALLDALAEPGVSCAYSDMRIVDRGGTEIAPTFWRLRAPHHRHPVALALANAVTGAAAALPAALLPMLLPLPRFRGLLHDMWLSVACAAAGRIAYLPRPLHDYVQHGANALGFPDGRSLQRRWRFAAHAVRGMAAVPPARWTQRQCEAWLAAGALFREAMPQRYVLLSEALRRIPAWHDPQARIDAQTFIALFTGASPARRETREGWRRVHRQGGGEAGLLGLDTLAAAALGASRVAAEAASLGAEAGARLAQHLWRHGSNRRTAEPEPAAPFSAPVFERVTVPVPVRPLPVSARRAAPLGMIMLLPELRLPDQRVPSFQAATYTCLALASRLSMAGVPLRLLLLDQTYVRFEEIASVTAYFPELSRMLGLSAMELAGGRGHGMEPLAIGAREVLLATDWRTAHAAHGMARTLGRSGFIYLIPDDEAAAHPHGALRSLAVQSYSLPHWPVYAAPLLAQHFGRPGSVIDSPVLHPAPRRRGAAPVLVFHAQPDQPLTMQALGLAALRSAVARLGPLASGWRFVGVGWSDPAPVVLGPGVLLQPEPALDRNSYRDLLAGAQIGLALHASTQPGLPMIEMAAAGLHVITNTGPSKTQAGLEAAVGRRVGGRITAVAPTQDALAAALTAALAQPAAAPRRPRDPAWPTSNEGAFPRSQLDTILAAGTATLGRQGKRP